MSDSQSADFWDLLVMHLDAPPLAQSSDDQAIVTLVSLFPDASSPAARARARSQVLGAAPTHPAPVSARLPLTSSPTLISNRLAPLPLQRPLWRLASLAAAILLLLAGGGIAILARGGELPGWSNRHDAGVISAVSDLPSDVLTRGVDPGRTNTVADQGLTSTPVRIWSYEVEGSIRTSPVVANGVIYVGVSTLSPADPGSVVAIRTRDGTMIWTHPTEHGLTAAFVLDDRSLYVVDDNGVIYALDALTGTERWHSALDDDPIYRFRYFGALLMVGGNLIVSTGSALAVASDGNSLFVAHPSDEWMEGEQHLYAISPTDGSIVWDRPGFPSDSSGGLFAVSATDGSLLWSHDGRPALLGPSSADGQVFYGEDSPTALVALDAGDGTVRWSTKIAPESEWDGLYSASISGETLLVGLRMGDAVTLDLTTGTILWRRSVFSPKNPDGIWMQSGIAIAGNVGIAEEIGALTAFSLSDQRVLWHLAVTTGFATPPPLPVVTEGTLFQVEQRTNNEQGQLNAYRPPGESP